MLTKPMELWSAAWALYKPRAWRLALIALASSLANLVVILILAVSAMGAISLVGYENFSSKLAGLSLGLIFLVIVIVISCLLLNSFITVWGWLALWEGLVAPTPISFAESYHLGYKRLLPFWWLQLIATTVTLLGFILLIVPGILLVVWFALVQPIFVVENKRGMAALWQSRQYVSGYWWPILGRLLFASLFIFLIMMGVSVVADVLRVGDLVSIVTPFFTTPFMFAYLLHLYRAVLAAQANGAQLALARV